MIRVRAAKTRDVDELAPLFDAYRRFYRRRRDLPGARRFLAERLKRSESVVFLAEDDRRCLGFVQLYPLFSSVELKRLWLLNDLFVVPAARRRGVGEALMERARRLAVETKASGLLLDTAPSNRKAQRLYEKLGWTQDGFLHYCLDL